MANAARLAQRNPRRPTPRPANPERLSALCHFDIFGTQRTSRLSILRHLRVRSRCITVSVGGNFDGSSHVRPPQCSNLDHTTIRDVACTKWTGCMDVSRSVVRDCCRCSEFTRIKRVAGQAGSVALPCTLISQWPSVDVLECLQDIAARQNPASTAFIVRARSDRYSATIDAETFPYSSRDRSARASVPTIKRHEYYQAASQYCIPRCGLLLQTE